MINPTKTCVFCKIKIVRAASASPLFWLRQKAVETLHNTFTQAIGLFLFVGKK